MEKQKTGKDRVVVVEPDPIMFQKLAGLGRALENYDVVCVNRWSDAGKYASTIYQDIIVLCTQRDDGSASIRATISRVASYCPEAKFVLFLADDLDPQDARVKAIVRKPDVSTLAKAINFLLSPTEIVAP